MVRVQVQAQAQAQVQVQVQVQVLYLLLVQVILMRGNVNCETLQGNKIIASRGLSLCMGLVRFQSRGVACSDRATPSYRRF